MLDCPLPLNISILGFDIYSSSWLKTNFLEEVRFWNFFNYLVNDLFGSYSHRPVTCPSFNCLRLFLFMEVIAFGLSGIVWLLFWRLLLLEVDCFYGLIYHECWLSFAIEFSFQMNCKTYLTKSEFSRTVEVCLGGCCSLSRLSLLLCQLNLQMYCFTVQTEKIIFENPFWWRGWYCKPLEINWIMFYMLQIFLQFYETVSFNHPLLLFYSFSLMLSGTRPVRGTCFLLFDNSCHACRMHISSAIR